MRLRLCQSECRLRVRPKLAHVVSDGLLARFSAGIWDPRGFINQPARAGYRDRLRPGPRLAMPAGRYNSEARPAAVGARASGYTTITCQNTGRLGHWQTTGRAAACGQAGSGSVTRTPRRRPAIGGQCPPGGTSLSADPAAPGGYRDSEAAGYRDRDRHAVTLGGTSVIIM